MERPSRETAPGRTAVSGMFMNDEFERAKEVYLEAGAPSAVPSSVGLKPLRPKLQRTSNSQQRLVEEGPDSWNSQWAEHAERS